MSQRCLILSVARILYLYMYNTSFSFFFFWFFQKDSNAVIIWQAEIMPSVEQLLAAAEVQVR